MSNQTSLMAFEQIKPELAALQKTVYEAISRYGPCTDNELIKYTGLNGSTLRPRRVELQREQWITIAGYKTQPNGRKAQLWRVI